jgi:hypothetical protein
MLAHDRLFLLTAFGENKIPIFIAVSFIWEEVDFLMLRNVVINAYELFDENILKIYIPQK